MKASTGLRDDMLDTNPFRTIMDDCFIKIYESGSSPPASADDAVVGTLLLTISDDGGLDGLHWAATASNGSIAKEAAQTWKGEVDTTGVADYFRIVLAGDAGGSSGTLQRIQGTVGTVGADLNLSSVSLTATEEKTLNHFLVSLPTL